MTSERSHLQRRGGCAVLLRTVYALSRNENVSMLRLNILSFWKTKAEGRENKLHKTVA